MTTTNVQIELVKCSLEEVTILTKLISLNMELADALQLIMWGRCERFKERFDSIIENKFGDQRNSQKQ